MISGTKLRGGLAGWALGLAVLMLAASGGDAFVTPSGTTITAAEGIGGNRLVATFQSHDSNPIAADYAATIVWGDGTSNSAGTITSSGSGQFAVTATHTFPEEGRFGPSVLIQDSVDSSSVVAYSTATVTDGALTPPLGSPPQVFTGVGGTSATDALNAFSAAIGGANNGTAPGPRSGGFRTLNWDAVKLNGTDFGGDTTLISSASTVGIPVNRFQNSGVAFGAVYAVSGDGFSSVNPNASGDFPAYSPSNIFAPFNNNQSDVSFVIPSGTVLSPPSNAPIPAGVRGFGAIFINVTTAKKTSIEYFNGTTSLGKFFVPTGAQAEPEFLGVLFQNPVITRARLTLGTEPIFDFDGSTSTPGNSPAGGTNLVAADNFVLSEPALTTISAAAGKSFNGVVTTFVDADPNGNAHDYTALINWGDGQNSKGSIAAGNSGAFNVSGVNTYARNGYYSVGVTVYHFGGSSFIFNSAAQVAAATATSLVSSANPSTAGESVTFTATVSTSLPGQGGPTGGVTFKDGSATLGTATLNASSKALFATSQLSHGTHSITAIYAGSADYLPSTSSAFSQTVF